MMELASPSCEELTNAHCLQAWVEELLHVTVRHTFCEMHLQKWFCICSRIKQEEVKLQPQNDAKTRNAKVGKRVKVKY